MNKECIEKAERQTKFRGFVRTFIDIYQSFPHYSAKHDLDHLIRLTKEDLPDAVGLEHANEYKQILEDLKNKITDDYDSEIVDSLRKLEKKSFADMLKQYCKCDQE